MPRAFPSSRRFYRRRFDWVDGFFESLRGGLVADDVAYTSGAAPIALDPVAFESTVSTGATAGAEVVTLLAGASPGQRHLVRVGTKGAAADFVRIQAGSDTSLRKDATAVAPVVVSKIIDATAYDAGGSVFQTAAVAGLITRVRTVVDVITGGIGTITLELGGTLVDGSSVTVADAAAVGVPDDSGAIAEISNRVAAGDPIEIVFNSTPTAGAIEVFIEITPDAQQAPVVVNALMPNTQYESAAIDVFALAPVAGNISRFRTIVDIVTAAIGGLTLELATVTVVGSDVTVAAVAVAGVPDDSGAIAAGATTAVSAGDAIGLVSDGVPTGGAVDCQIEITPTVGKGPVIVEKVFTATEYDAGTSVFAVSAIAGHVSRVRTVTDVLTAGAGALTLELATVEVAGSDVVIADGAVVGEPDDSGAIPKSLTTAIAAGDPIEITSDGVPTAGEVHVYIEITPDSEVSQIDLVNAGDYALLEFDGAAWSQLYGNGIAA